MDTRQAERERIRRAHEDHVIRMSARVFAAAGHQDRLEALVYEWQPKLPEDIDLENDPMVHLQLTEALKAHVRAESARRSTYVPMFCRQLLAPNPVWDAHFKPAQTEPEPSDEPATFRQMGLL